MAFHPCRLGICVTSYASASAESPLVVMVTILEVPTRFLLLFRRESSSFLIDTVSTVSPSLEALFFCGHPLRAESQIPCISPLLHLSPLGLIIAIHLIDAKDRKLIMSRSSCLMNLQRQSHTGMHLRNRERDPDLRASGWRGWGRE